MAKKSEKKTRNKTIKRLIKGGKSTRKVGKAYGISNKRAWDIANRKKTKKKAKRKVKKK